MDGREGRDRARLGELRWLSDRNVNATKFVHPTRGAVHCVHNRKAAPRGQRGRTVKSVLRAGAGSGRRQDAQIIEREDRRQKERRVRGRTEREPGT